MLEECHGEPINLSTVEIIFGKSGIIYGAVNFCILYAKWFIHLHRDKDIVSFQAFKHYLKNTIIIEKQIYTNKRKIERFYKLYSAYTRWLEQ